MMKTNIWFLDADNYLKNIINNKSITPKQLTDARLWRVHSIIKEWAGDDLNEIKLSGSSAKEMVVSGEADTDIFVSLKSTTTSSLGNIYKTLASALKANSLPVEEHTVALQTRDYDLKIDIVPGRIQSGYQLWHSVYNSETGTWLQTNIDGHITKVISSGRRDEIRAIKIWSRLNYLKFPSIYIELIVMEALYNMNKQQLANNLETVLSYLATDFVDKRVVDPSNSGNIISDYALTTSEKNLIAAKAKENLLNGIWENFIY